MEENNQEVIIEEVFIPETSEITGGEKTTRMKMSPLSVPQAIILNAFIIGICIIVAAYITHGASSLSAKVDAPADSGTAAAVAPDIKKVSMTNEPYIGASTARVAIAYWSDYQCPFCKQFETTTFQKIVNDYVKTGKVAVIFKDFSFLGSDSTTAALYGRAVWQLYPEQYFAWRTAMFNSQDAENSGFGDETSVKKLTATIVGIDVSKVAAAVAANKDTYQKAIDADRDEAVKFGIQGTPSFITGTTLIPGVADYASFQKVLDAQLK